MRIAACSFLSLALLGCARASTPESTPEPATEPVEAEGPAPATESAAAPIEEGLCALGSVAEWGACEGQRVQLRGRAAEHVQQHPILAVPEDVSPDGRNSQQGYIDAEGVQLIVLTKAPFDCRGAVSVVGTLRGIDLGGEPGTKGSYSGWALEDAAVTCE